MKQAFLVRDDISAECIRGVLVIDGHAFQILERPWRDNQSNVSCIPARTYTCRFMRRSSSGKYRNVYWLQDVGGRFGILIHSGNIVSHTLGCLIIGARRGRLAGRRAVLNSRTSLGELVDIVGEEAFKLTIMGNQEWELAA